MDTDRSCPPPIELVGNLPGGRRAVGDAFVVATIGRPVAPGGATHHPIGKRGIVRPDGPGALARARIEELVGEHLLVWVVRQGEGRKWLHDPERERVAPLGLGVLGTSLGWASAGFWPLLMVRRGAHLNAVAVAPADHRKSGELGAELHVQLLGDRPTRPPAASSSRIRARTFGDHAGLFRLFGNGTVICATALISIYKPCISSSL